MFPVARAALNLTGKSGGARMRWGGFSGLGGFVPARFLALLSLRGLSLSSPWARLTPGEGREGGCLVVLPPLPFFPPPSFFPASFIS